MPTPSTTFANDGTISQEYLSAIHQAWLKRPISQDASTSQLQLAEAIVVERARSVDPSSHHDTKLRGFCRWTSATLVVAEALSDNHIVQRLLIGRLSATVVRVSHGIMVSLAVLYCSCSLTRICSLPRRAEAANVVESCTGDERQYGTEQRKALRCGFGRDNILQYLSRAALSSMAWSRSTVPTG